MDGLADNHSAMTLRADSNHTSDRKRRGYAGGLHAKHGPRGIGALFLLVLAIGLAVPPSAFAVNYYGRGLWEYA